MKASTRISGDILISKRLDPYYYQRHFIKHSEKIRSHFKEMKFIGDIFTVMDGTHDSVETKEVKDDIFNVPFLRAQDIGSCYLKKPGAFLRKLDHEKKCKRSQIRTGDILLSIMASTGESCFYSNSCPSDANANRAVGILRCENRSLNDLDKQFIVALLSSKIGSLELSRNLKGSIQQRLNLEDIAESEIPDVDPLVRAYVGGKVWQAELLRERSKAIESEIEEFFKLQNWSGEKPGTRKFYKAQSIKLHPHRLDASYYDPVYLNLQDVLEGLNSVPIMKVAKQIKESWSRVLKEFYYLEIGSINLNTGMITPSRISVKEAPSRAQLLVQPWDVIVSTVRPERKKCGVSSRS